MKQTLLLMVLTLVMCSINVSAQTKKYKVEDDGFEWYQITENEMEGAIDKYGNLIIPPVYKVVYYMNATMFGNTRSHLTDKAGHFVCREDNYGKKTRFIIYNRRGQVLLKTRNKYSDIYLTYHIPAKKFCFHVSIAEGEKRHYGIISRNCEDENPCVYEDISAANKYPIEVKQNGQWKKLSANQMNTLLMGFDFFKNNELYTEKISSLTWNGSISSQNESLHGSTQSSNSSLNNNNSSGNNTTTVVVEHHRDPVPVQQWQACFACGGMGTMGCDNCGGGGTKYIGDRLHRCSRCNGRGIIPCNVCYGNKGQYITVYQ